MDDVKISRKYSLPKEMKAWVLKSPNELELKTKAIPTPRYSEVLVKKSVKNVTKLTIEEKINAAELAKKTPDKKKK